MNFRDRRSMPHTLTKNQPRPQTRVADILNLSSEVVKGLTLEELKNLAKTIEESRPEAQGIANYQWCQQWYEQTLQEIQQRQMRHDQVQTTLNQTLQAIRELNPRFFDREFANLNLEPLLQKVLDGKEAQAQQELAACCSTVQRIYEDYKLIRLARIKCRVQEAKWQLRRTTIACRLFPFLGLLVAGILLHLHLDLTQTLAAVLLGVTPVMLWITHSIKKEMKQQAKQELEKRNGLLHDEWQRLNTQETQVMNHWSTLLHPV